MTLRTLSLVSICCVAASCASLKHGRKISAQTPPRNERVVYHGGPIVTMGPTETMPEAVVTRGTQIVFVGSWLEARRAFPNALDFNLQGQTLMPGFIEQHLHPFLASLTLIGHVAAPEAWGLPAKTWPAVRDRVTYLATLQAAEAALPSEQPLWSWGYHPLFHGSLSRTDLDAVSDSRPIAVWHRSCHEFFLNTAMIAYLGLTETDLKSLRAEVRAQINWQRGHFFENGALLYLLPRVMPELAAPERYRAGLQQVVKMLHTNGVTAFMEPGALIDAQSAALFRDVLGAPETPMYSFFVPETKSAYHAAGTTDLIERVASTTAYLPRIGKVRFLPNAVKLLADGAIVSQLMVMQDGYLDGHEGEWIQPPAELEAVTKVFWDAGYQLHIHVNGDGGLEEVLAVLERRQEQNPRKNHRTNIVHFANSTESQIQRIAKLGAIISANPYYVTAFGNAFAKVGLGPERAHAMVRLGPAEAQGVSISLHSDLPIAPANPLYLAWAAATRQTAEGNVLRPDLALSPEAALRAITLDAAYSWGMENTLGSIEVGKIANFTVLDQNPVTTDPQSWPSIEVQATVFEGMLFPVRRASP